MEREQELVGGGHKQGAERERELALRPRHARQPGRRRGAEGHTGRRHSALLLLGEAKISAIEVR